MSEPNAPEVERPSTPPEPGLPVAVRTVRRRRSARTLYTVVFGVLALLVGAAWLGRARFRPVVPGEVAPACAASTLAGEPVGLER